MRFNIACCNYIYIYISQLISKILFAVLVLQRQWGKKYKVNHFTIVNTIVLNTSREGYYNHRFLYRFSPESAQVCRL